MLLSFFARVNDTLPVASALLVLKSAPRLLSNAIHSLLSCPPATFVSVVRLTLRPNILLLKCVRVSGARLCETAYYAISSSAYFLRSKFQFEFNFLAIASLSIDSGYLTGRQKNRENICIETITVRWAFTK